MRAGARQLPASHACTSRTSSTRRAPARQLSGSTPRTAMVWRPASRRTGVPKKSPGRPVGMGHRRPGQRSRRQARQIDAVEDRVAVRVEVPPLPHGEIDREGVRTARRRRHDRGPQRGPDHPRRIGRSVVGRLAGGCRHRAPDRRTPARRRRRGRRRQTETEQPPDGTPAAIRRIIRHLRRPAATDGSSRRSRAADGWWPARGRAGDGRCRPGASGGSRHSRAGRPVPSGSCG